jgi:hypothetical protein
MHQRGCTAKRPNLSQSSRTTKTPEATKKIGPIFIFIFVPGNGERKEEQNFGNQESEDSQWEQCETQIEKRQIVKW